MAETPFKMGGAGGADDADGLAGLLRARGFGSPAPGGFNPSQPQAPQGAKPPEQGPDSIGPVGPGLPEMRPGGALGTARPMGPESDENGSAASQSAAALGSLLAVPGRGGTESRGPATSSSAIDGPGKMLFGQRVRHQLDPLASGTAPGMGMGGGNDDEVKRLLELLGQGA